MGINSEYNGDYFDDDLLEACDDDLDYVQYDEFTREDFEDLYSTELLNMWYMVTEEFPEKSYQSFCDFCFGGNVLPARYTEEPPEYFVSLWASLNSEAHFLLEDKTIQDFFVYIYKC
jgi:hypothetical protein